MGRVQAVKSKAAADRFSVERAVVESSLTYIQKLVMLTLAVWSDNETSAIPDGHRKSLREIASATGLGKSTVARCLDSLDRTGWIERARPSKVESRTGARTGYRLLVPQRDTLVPQRDRGVPLRDRGPSPAAGHPSPAAGQGVVPQRDRRSITQEHTLLKPMVNAEALTLFDGQTTDSNVGQDQAGSVSTAIGGDDPWFMKFWGMYPRRISRKAAFKSWEKAIKDGADPSAVIEAVGRYIVHLEVTGHDIAYPATWLNQARWEDEYETAKPDGKFGTYDDIFN